MREKSVHCNILPRFTFLFLLSTMIPVGLTRAEDMAEAIAKGEQAASCRS